VAVRLLAESEVGKDVVSDIKKLVEKAGQENLAVQLCASIVLDKAGETEEALNVLSKHQGSLDAYVHVLEIYFEVHILTRRRVQCGLDYTDPPSAEPDRPCRERGPARTKMGTGQLACQSCRIMGRHA